MLYSYLILLILFISLHDTIQINISLSYDNVITKYNNIMLITIIIII